MKDTARAVLTYLAWGAVGLPAGVAAWVYLTRVPAAHPEAALHVSEGAQAYARGDYGDALVAFEHARALAPDDESAYRGLMRARVAIAASEPGRLGPDTAPEIRYEANFLLTQGQDDRALCLVALGNAFVAEGRVAEGARHLDEAARLDSGSAHTRTARGLLLLRRGETREAGKAELEAAIGLAPNHLPALIPLAQLLLGDGDRARAAELAQRILSVREDATARQILREAAGPASPPAAAAPPASARPVDAVPQALRPPSAPP